MQTIEHQLLTKTVVGFKFEILLNNASLFEETATVTSNNQGLVEWLIGSSSENGLSGIDWAAGNLVLRVSVDINGGQNYSSIYESAIQSVPTAMYAAKSGDSEGIYIAISSLDAKTADILSEVNHNRELSEENRAIIKDCITYLEENSARIEDNRQRIDRTETMTYDIENMLDDTRNHMNEMQVINEDRYMMLETIINELQNRITNLEDIITTLQTRIKALENN